MITKISKISSAIDTIIARNPMSLFLFCLGIITIARIGLLFISDVNLGPDETQYWFWSLTPDFGYFSKPPMIAWLINLTTGLFGHSEWAVRLSSPLLHGGAALFLYTVGRMLYVPQAGFWMGTGWLLLPGVGFASGIISTDTPLLFFWCGAMLFLLRMIAFSNKDIQPSYIDAISLGVCLGLGFLSKYAMIYFPIASFAGFLLLPVMRKNGLPRALLISTAVMVALIIPNIVWNMGNDFQTLSHTAANANWQGSMFHPGELAEFWLAQFGIIGPIIFTAFLIGVVIREPFRSPAPTLRQQELLLILLAITPLLIVSVQAFISRAHANWAAASYPAITVLAIAWLLRKDKKPPLLASHGIHLIIAITLGIGLSSFQIVDTAGFSNAIKRVRGWDIQGHTIEETASNYDAVMADDRELIGEILYYGKQADRPFMAWNSNNQIDDHYEAFLPYEPHRYERLLYITKNPDAAGAHHMFETVTLVETSKIDLKRGRSRTLYLFSLSGFRG